MDRLTGMQTFVASVDAGSFTAAADRLGLSKKLVSKYVAELEARLGVRLLHRTTRRHSLTPAGQRYYEKCTEILEALDAAEAELCDDQRNLNGTVRLSAPITFGERYLLPSLVDLQSEHPGLLIDLRLSDRYVDLADDAFDLAVRIGGLADSALRTRRLAQSEIWTVAAPSYLKARGTPKAPRDLRHHDCVQDSNLRSGLTWAFGDQVSPERVTIKPAVMVDSAPAILRLAEAGAGIARSPDYVAADSVADGRLIRILDGYRPPALDIQAVYLPSGYVPARVRAVLDHLVQAFRSRSGW